MVTSDNNGKLKIDMEVLDRAYPEIDIESIKITDEFTPDLMERLPRSKVFRRILWSLLSQVIALVIGFRIWTAFG